MLLNRPQTREERAAKILVSKNAFNWNGLTPFNEQYPRSIMLQYYPYLCPIPINAESNPMPPLIPRPERDCSHVRSPGLDPATDVV